MLGRNNLNFYTALLINFGSKTVDQSEDPGGGASVVSFSLQLQVGRASDLFEASMAEEVLCAVFFKTIPERCISHF